MAYYDRDYDFYDQGAGYEGMGYRNYYGRGNHRAPYYDAPPGMMHRYDGRRSYNSEPFFDNYRRDYRLGGGYTDGRYGVLPREEVIHRDDPPPWVSDGYRHGGHRGGYAIDYPDYHGGQDYARGNYRHLQDDYGDHHPSRRQEVELYVPLCCDKCERKLRYHLEFMQGVETITMDQTTKKVVVFGYVDRLHVLNRVRLLKPEAEFWHPQYMYT